MYSVLNVNSLLKIVQILISFNYWYYKFSLILNNFWSLSVAIKLFYFGFLACLHFGTCICSYYTYTYEKYNKQTYLANSSIQPRFSLLLWLKWARFERTNWVYCYELPNYESTMYKSKSKGYVSRSKNLVFHIWGVKWFFFFSFFSCWNGFWRFCFLKNGTKKWWPAFRQIITHFSDVVTFFVC